MRRTSLAVAIALATMLPLAGCAGDQSVPEPEVAHVSTNIFSQDSYQQLATEVTGILAQADENHDAGALGDRVGGPLRVQREAEYQLAKITQVTTPTSINLDPKEAVLSSGTAFPRSLMAIDMTKTPRGIGTLLVWQQNSARQNYQLWSAIDLFPSPPKIEIVNTQDDKPGYLEADATDYAVDPQTVLEAYAKYASDRQMGDVKFNEEDPLYQQTKKQSDDLTAALNGLGEAKTVFSVPNKDIRAVATKNGGLIITGELRYDMTVTRTKDGASLKLGSLIGALAAGEKDGVVVVDNPVTAQYATSVAFYVPPKDADEPVHMIGASVPALLSVTKAE